MKDHPIVTCPHCGRKQSHPAVPGVLHVCACGTAFGTLAAAAPKGLRPETGATDRDREIVPLLGAGFRKCPDCGERIQRAARICRYCGCECRPRFTPPPSWPVWAALTVFFGLVVGAGILARAQWLRLTERVQASRRELPVERQVPVLRPHETAPRPGRKQPEEKPVQPIRIETSPKFLQACVLFEEGCFHHERSFPPAPRANAELLMAWRFFERARVAFGDVMREFGETHPEVSGRVGRLRELLADCQSRAGNPREIPPRPAPSQSGQPDGGAR